MIIKHRFLLIILLCWPFVSTAVDVSNINNATTISEAISAAKEELSKLNLQGPQKAQAEQQLATAINDAKCGPVTEGDVSEGEYCPATDNRLKSINDKTKIGDECSSTNIAGGEVVWHKQLVKGKKVCTCLAYACNDGYHSEKGGCVKDAVKLPNCPRQEYGNVPDIKNGNDALKFCETKGGTQCKTVKAIGNYNGIKGKVLCNPEEREMGEAKQRIADSKIQYYNCGQKDTKFPNDITCKFVSDFDSFKVTPMEAEGLMKEWAIKKHNDDIKCDDKTHRTTGIQPEDYRQCISKKNPKMFYEFDFKSLDNGNNGFYGALCAIWGLKGGENLCKSAAKTQCDEMSAAINRTFYIGGSAELKGKDCVINAHPKAESAPIALFNTKVLTKEDIRTISNIDPLHFYDKTLQINANSDVYKAITNYLFVDQHLPTKQFTCGAGIVDNVPYYNMSRTDYDVSQKKIRDCQALANPTSESYGADIARCNKNAPTSMNGDLITCEYDGKTIDFLFKKLDVKWNRKSIGGYQGLRCLSEGGDFTGKSCTLASKTQCDSFNERFKKDYPSAKGMEWDDDIGACVLKDAKQVGNVQKVAVVTGMVTLTLVTSVSGGPVVWALAAVEGAALVTEAVTEEKISNWAESFLAEAANCKNNNSNCANAVMKKHIARIIEGSNQFNETQNKQIAKQTERLLGMLDDKILSEIVDKGELSGFIGEERDPDLEKSIRAYYGTQLTSQEKALLVTKKVATVATFATLIGGGIMAGLRQSFKHNLIHIDKLKQARWVDLKILRETDVAADVFAMSKTGQKAAAKAGTIASTTTDVTTDATKSAIRKTSATAIDKKAVEEATSEYEAAKKRYDYVKKYMSEHNGNLPDGMSKQGLAEVNENMAKAEKKLKDLGQEVSTAEPLQIGKQTAVKPTGSKSVESSTKPQSDTAVKKPVSTTPRSKVRQKLSDDVNTAIDDIKSGKRSEIVLESSDLSSDEWKSLKAELEKDGLELREQGTLHYVIEKKPAVKSVVKPADDVGRVTGGTIKSKAEKIAEAKQRGDLGYHGTDANIAMDDMIRPSANTSEQLGNVGYGIAQNYDDAEAYAIRRLVERQNPGASINFSRENGMLIITSDKSLQLTNKTGYVYTTAKESSIGWDTMYNGLGGWKAAKMPNSVEILEKKALNLDDMVRQGKVKIIEPKPANVSSAATGARSATHKAANVTTLRKTASSNFDTYLAEAKTAKNGKSQHIIPKERLTPTEWEEINRSLASENVQLVEITHTDGKKYMQFVSANHVDAATTASTASKSVKKAAPTPRPVVTQEGVNDVVLRNHEVARAESQYVNSVYTSGPEGEQWVALWEEHAPKNQSLENFQKMYGNDLNKAESHLKNFDSAFWKEAADEADKKASELFDKYAEKHGFGKYNEYVDVRNVNVSGNRLTPQTPGLEKWTQEEIDEAQRLYDAIEAKKAAALPPEWQTLYSTYDPQVARINKKYEADTKKLRQEYNEIEQVYKSEHGTNNGLEGTTEYKKWQTERDKVAEQYQYEIGQIALSNKEYFAENMSSNVWNLFGEDFNLGNRVNSWDDLSKEEKINLLQDIVDAYATKYDTPYVKILSEDIPIKDNFITNGYYTPGTNNITINTNEPINRSVEDVLSTLLHEYGHATDYLTPDKGSVGAQIMKNNLFYTSKGPTYVLSPTEQSSYSISGAITTEGNWPLQKAIKSAASAK